ncbi:MAG: hypothetical protein US86_C0001G0141 [Candidatus Daviesbacteria bacterium GW2011_GWA2_38_24]|uniref:GHMP kinase n=1 Tax=Candidatus Daviesbacteria bacterium GW2011_GWA2_38_24 TaxID=1618422 RepID=A0A0G0M0P9_9BACT|nr:MAG: hypothetical protein US86_C0001G0141 [Candidatus Daviesbacteria bacterium GW2011_GWA2_38_24]OGE24353.1 MAG: GHMP kinase [Candidatus Daviesbacteria bacterium RIFCSPHIGHO2_01_FULL_38_8]
MIITQTPLRLSFFGGNTDFPDYYLKHGGCVLTTAIDKYIYCIVTQRFDKKIYINYSKKEIVNSVDEIEHELVREALKKTGVENGVEITFLADIPSEGSGLGSSSAVLVGVLNALHHFIGETPSARQLAEEAVDIEVNILKKPIGVQDQYIAAFGGLRFIEFHPSNQVRAERIELTNGIIHDINNQLMLFFTGKTRKSSSVLTKVKSSLVQNEDLLYQTKLLTKKGYQLIKKHDLSNLGSLLDEGWRLKISLSDGITNAEINSMYQKAREAGALGGKIAGAGGGGFLLLVVPSDKRSRVRKALGKFQELPFRLEIDGSKVIFSVRRY